jgi:hypothetical protein
MTERPTDEGNPSDLDMRLVLALIAIVILFAAVAGVASRRTRNREQKSIAGET